MNISAKTEYACIAVLELAAHYNKGGPVRIRDIAESQGIPSRFLVQILLQLKASGLVTSTRGAAGGYQLQRDPSTISLAEVMAISEGKVQTPESCAARSTPVTQALFETWQTVADAERELLEGVSFADLLEQLADRTENMYYI